MTCKECLAALRIESLREMAPDSPVLRHCATCPDCARVTTMLRDKEYETATVLNSLPPMSSPLAVAENAVRTSQRRRVGRVVVMLSGVIGAIIIWIVAATMIVLPMQRAGMMPGNESDTRLRTETIQLSCLSPQQAADIINPYVRSDGSVYFVPQSGVSAITVRATPDELAKSRNLIAQFEKDPTAACRLPMTIIQRVRDGVVGSHPQPGTHPDPPTGKAKTPPKKD